MIPALLVTIICIGLLFLVQGNIVWALMVFSGMFMDGFMAIIVTMLMETKGVGMEYSGMALGIVFTIAQVGSLVSPPLGNAFADINAGLPFAFWAVLSVSALVTFAFVKETGWRKAKAID
jgi:hypothetical protein